MILFIKKTVIVFRGWLDLFFVVDQITDKFAPQFPNPVILVMEERGRTIPTPKTLRLNRKKKKTKKNSSIFKSIICMSFDILKVLSLMMSLRSMT